MLNPGPNEQRRPEGTIVQLDGESYYRIAHSNAMPPFLMSIPSDTDLWMFVASNGGLTAGRGDADGSLFPYETVDRLYDSHHHTGPITLIRAPHAGATVLWQPFQDQQLEQPSIERHLYKSMTGNSVVFEEVHRELQLAFRYRWSACDEFGWVRTATLANLSDGARSLDLLDGLRDVLPYGGSLAMYQQQSCLVDAYKRSECDPSTGLAIYSLSAKMTDRAEAAEELRANTVWCHGLTKATYALGEEVIAAFRRGGSIANEKLRTGRRGNFLVNAAVNLAPHGSQTWFMAADVRRTPVQIVALRDELSSHSGPGSRIEAALARTTQALMSNVAASDGLQCTGQPGSTMHHFANVLFNNMRGGVFAAGYQLPVADLGDFLRTRNLPVAERHAEWLKSLGSQVSLAHLLREAASQRDPDLERLALEYLPLHFGRRHGDPSRPWNRFSIRPRRADGSPALYYEGNWRDVFQNWEALAQSFPGYLPSMVAKFVNASTMDGFNPYRITRDGVDWEVVEPDSPWSYIGYWGDHQIVYLLRLLESLARVAPDALAGMLERPVFSYANVPYRIKPYELLKRDPHASIDFDAKLQAKIEARIEQMGTDGRLVAGPDGAIHHATLVEKLLVSALARLSNFVPGGGIWMNTQRPEWNDANNALAGNGVSTVTLCYLRRYLSFFAAQLTARGNAPVPLSAEVAEWARAIESILIGLRPEATAGPQREETRKRMLDALGEAFSQYRARVYTFGLTPGPALPVEHLLTLCRVALEHIDASLAQCRREDGLYHAYHVLGPLDTEQLELRPLYEMLEGQVAALSSGAMTPSEAVRVLDQLFASSMYDPERLSFMLYPERQLPAFLDKNRVPAEQANAIALLRSLAEAGEDSVLAFDATGAGRFHPDLSQARVLAARLDTLARDPKWAAHVVRDRKAVLELFESVFHHRAFTGRSGTMYGYEGLGCIYWHMVAKLLLAVQELALAALDSGDAAATALTAHYFRIRAGLGYQRSPSAYGAFPTDPYSHTPRHGGAQQPGMTGQVKEEILTRFGELGVSITGGKARFSPRLLQRSEFLTQSQSWRHVGLDGAIRELEVPANALAFTWCGTPIVYHLAADAPWVRLHRHGAPLEHIAGDTLDVESTSQLLDRSGALGRIEVGVAPPNIP